MGELPQELAVAVLEAIGDIEFLRLVKSRSASRGSVRQLLMHLRGLNAADVPFVYKDALDDFSTQVKLGRPRDSFFHNVVKFSSSDYKKVGRNLKRLSTKLKAKCQNGNLKFDVDIENFLAKKVYDPTDYPCDESP